MAAILSDYGPNAVYDAHDGTPPTTGLDALVTRYQEIFASVPRLRFEPVNVRFGDGFFVAEHRASNSSVEGEDHVSFDIVDVITVDDGRTLRKDTHIGRPHTTKGSEARRPDGAAATVTTAEDSERFLASFEATWQAPTVDGLVNLYTEDATLLHPGMKSPVRGRGAITAYWSRTLADLDTIHGRVVDHGRGTHGLFVQVQLKAVSDGTETHWEAIDRFELEGAKAKAGTAYFDPKAILALPIITTP